MGEGTLGALIVGTGFGILTHLRALRRAGFEVRGLVGRDAEKTASRAAKVGVEGAYTDLDLALAQPGVDLVTIATPPHTHCEIALRAIAAGKHVVCEKPFARDVAEAERMLDAAERAGVVHMLGTEFRFATGQALAARALRQGVIGEPRMVSMMMNVPVLADPAAQVPEWWSDASQGGGWLGAYASHIIDQLRSALGEFEGVSASVQRVGERDWSADDGYTIHFRIRGGVSGVMQSTAAAWGQPVICSNFYGTKGSLGIVGERVHVTDRSGQRVLEVPDDLVNPPPEGPPPELMVTAYDHLHAAGFDLAPYTRLFAAARARIQGDAIPADPAPATFADGVAGQRVLDAVRRSSAERAWVAIE